MALFDEILVDHIYKDLEKEIQDCYLEEEDIKQEIRFALCSLSIPRAKTYIKRVLKNFPKDRIFYSSSHELTWLLVVLVERCESIPQTVLKLRYGLLDGQEHSKKDVARRFRVNQSEVKLIEKNALAHIQRSPGIDYIKRKFLRLRNAP